MAKNSDEEADEILREHRELNCLLVLVADTKSRTWTVQIQGTDEEDVRQQYLELKRDKTPAIMLDTTDFVVF